MRLILLLVFASGAALSAAPADWFGIHVVDAATGRGVPLITLTTTNHVAHVSDNAGWIAFQEPELMERSVFFHVSGPGYTVPKDGFGYAGVRLTPKAGAIAEVKLTRANLAERLYRVTGEGLYRDAALLGQPVPVAYPSFSGVTGQDSVQAVPWQGRVFWLWGDTTIPSYPLGNFHCTCAWSDLPSRGGLEPARGIALEYLTGPAGAPRPMVPSTEPGVVWVFGLLVVPDAVGQEHLVGHFGRFKDLGTRLAHGLVEFDSTPGHFVVRKTLEAGQRWQHPRGNAVRVTEPGGDWFYFTESFAVTRVRATYESVLDPAAYEALAWSATAHDYRWQKAEPPVTQSGEAKAVGAGLIPESAARFQLKDALTGKPVVVHRASTNWNAHRQRWIMIATEQGGAVSALGEVWFAESTSPAGPWTTALKIASHPNYSFYNPRQHAFFDEEGGRVIYFEGTYTTTFSGNPVPTPRYDYNQLLYRLDLGDPRLEALRPARTNAVAEPPGRPKAAPVAPP